MSSTRSAFGATPSPGDPACTGELAIGSPEASTTATCRRSVAGAKEARIRWTRAGSSAEAGAGIGDLDVASDRGDRGRAIGMGHEQPVQPRPLEHACHRGLGAAELYLR